MINRIHLIDYMVYKNVDVVLDNASMIAVVGENGSGKSAFLEAIPYAYYGISRDGTGNLSRLNGNGDHYVEVHKDEWIIVRGRKNNKPVLKVYKDKELVSKGSEANQYIIDNITGINASTYLLVSFYGLGDTKNADTLIRVRPAERLETLQKIADVDIYKTLHKKVKTEHASVVKAVEMINAKIETMTEIILDKEECTNLSGKKEVLIRNMATDGKLLHAERERREKLKIKEDKYRNLLTRKDILKKDIDAAKNMLASLETEADVSIRDKEQLLEDAKNVNDSLGIVESSIKNIDKEKIESELSSVKNEKSRLNLMLTLKTLVTGENIKDRCPLCGAELSEGVSEQWAKDVKSLKEKLGNISLIESKKNDELNKLAGFLNDAQAKMRKAEDIHRELKQADNDISLNKQAFKKQKSIIEIKTNEYTDLLESVNATYQNIPMEVNDINTKIEDLITNITTSKQEIQNISNKLLKNEKYNKIVKGYKKDLKALNLKDKAYSVLEQAWNRYGIPLNLIRSLYISIQDKASLIYQEFDNGYIRVEEVEDRGKPGVSFVLEDRKGKRTFNMLSLGEKVMFFISVRVAIAQIISAIKNVTIETIVFDEALGNLSPNRRDSLIKMLNKVLRKLFPQVMMVSHTEMWDIFSKTVRVQEKNDTSVIDVV